MAFMASSSSSATAAGGIRIADGAEPKGRMPWVSLEGDGDVNDEGSMEAALARAGDCDVYVGHSSGARRLVAWLRAELELLGVRCAACDRRRFGDAPKHATARAAMDAAAAGVVVVTPASLANPYALDEFRVFADRGALVPVLVGGLARADLVAENVVDRRGDVWGTHGGELWKAYGGEEEEWRAAVEALARADPCVVVGDGYVRDRVLDVLDVLGARLGRRPVVAAVKGWRDADKESPELPFPRNAAFLGREKELADLEAMLRGSTTKAAAKRAAQDLYGLAEDHGPFINGAVCVSGESGAGKTELALEFAHQHAQDYKLVLWLHGEPRFLRHSYLSIADRLDVAVGDNVSAPPERARRLMDIEGDAIAKVRKGLARDVPYLVLIDNLESERDWWDSRAVQELLPLTGRTHVIITTRLPRLQSILTLNIGNLPAPESTRLMKGTRAFGVEDVTVLRSIEEYVGGAPLGLALVGAILSELNLGPGELILAMSNAPHRAPTWGERDDPVLRDNPGLVRLLDASLTLLGREAAGLGAAVGRLLEASSFFAPAPIPVATLARAACSSRSANAPLWKRVVNTLHLTRGSSRPRPNAELEALVKLGLARRCTKAGHVSVHAVFRVFGRKIGSGKVGRRVLRAIVADRIESEHAWAACLSAFKFEAPAAAVDLPSLDLARFSAGHALSLAERAAAAHSTYAAAIALLREATDAVRRVEDQYGLSPRRSAGGCDLDPRAFQDLAQARASLLMARARMMVRGGEYGIAEDHCLTALNIFGVVCGAAHQETGAARAFLEQAVRPYLSN
jgi:hypothetical protein